MTDAPAVAIVGMSGRFPGAPDLDTYWTNLRDGVCSISDFSTAELIAAGVGADERRNTRYVAAKGYLADADRFEAELFGFNRTEAELLDPQHRLLLECTWAALEDAGIDPRAAPARTGVYVGGSPSEHMIAAQADRRLAAELGAMQVRTLTDREFLAPWLSYRFGLDGPSLSVQAACATSLAAVHLAVQALLLGECDTAVAGGVSLDSIHRRGYVHQEGGILSPDGRCRPFDEKAAGTVAGNGVGVLVLRRLEDAEADRDPVRAVIRGTAVTNDGRAKLGFTAPSVDRQSAAVLEAWAAAGLHPSAAQYLEAHGTATQLGDRVEVAALSAAVGDAADNRCGLGSVKSNIGHLDSAAGVAALIKVVLMLEHRMLVPTAGVTRAHGDLRLSDTPFDLLTGSAPWQPPTDGPRLAGVCGAAVGGTNVHVVLAEAPDTTRSHDPAQGPELLPISARTPEQLRRVAGRLAAALRAAQAPELVDVGHTLRTGRARLDARTYVLAADTAAAVAALQAVADGASRPSGRAGDGLRALGDAWVAGEDVAWPASGDGARRIHLPTYPFAGQHRGALSLPVPMDPGELSPTVPVPAGPTPVSSAAVLDLLGAGLGLTGPEQLDLTYFAVGGDSLTAVHLVGRLRDEFDMDVPIELFLEQLTIRELAARIVAEETDDELLGSLLDEIESQG